MTLSIFVASTLAPRLVGPLRAAPRDQRRDAGRHGRDGAAHRASRPGGSYVGDVLPGGLLAATRHGVLARALDDRRDAGRCRASQSGLGSGLLNTSRLMGGALGLAILTTIADAQTRARRGRGHGRRPHRRLRPRLRGGSGVHARRRRAGGAAATHRARDAGCPGRAGGASARRGRGGRSARGLGPASERRFSVITSTRARGAPLRPGSRARRARPGARRDGRGARTATRRSGSRRPRRGFGGVERRRARAQRSARGGGLPTSSASRSYHAASVARPVVQGAGREPTSVASRGSSATACAVRRRRSEPPTRRQSSPLPMCLVPCSASSPRSASSRREARRGDGVAALGRLAPARSARPIRRPARDRRRPARKASARSSPTTEATPRGQNRLPTRMLTAQPIATSSIRITPTLQPTGTSRLKSTATVTVKAAWPTANGAVPGA